MALFKLKLQKTYFQQGFFNVTVDFDRFVRSSEGPVQLRLGRNGLAIQGTINRRANQNATARIRGGPKLRDWFMSNFEVMDTVVVDLTSTDVLVLDKLAK